MVVVMGNLVCSDGTNIPILNASMSNGTSAEVKSNAAFSVVATSVGTYAAGKTVVASTPMVGTNSVAWAYLLRRGQVIQTYPCGKAGSAQTGIVPLCNSVTLQAGDAVHAMPNSAADRECTLTAYTASGRNHIFTVTPTGGDTFTLVSIITGQGIGDTFQGETIVKAWASSVDGILITSGGGVVVVNDKGVPVGLLAAQNTQVQSAQYVNCSIPVALNFAAQVITSG